MHVRFIHYRVPQGGGIPQRRFQLMRQEVWPPEPRGGLTAAVAYEDEVLVGVAFAACSEKDNYSKKIGRDIAYGRLMKRVQEANQRKADEEADQIAFAQAMGQAI